MDPLAPSMQEVPPAPSVGGQLQSLGSLLRNSWRVYRNLFKVFFGLVLITFVASVLPVVTLQVSLIVSAVEIFLAAILSVITSIAMVDVIVTDGADGVASSLQKGMKLFWPYVWVVFLVGLVVMGGLFLLIIPGLIMGVMLEFSSYALIAENKRGLDALAQSWYYIKGRAWSIVWRLLVIGIISLAVVLILGTLTKLGHGSYDQNLIYTLVKNLISAILEPFALIYVILIYRDLKQIKGEIDPASLQSKRKKLGWFIAASIIIPLVLTGLVIFGLVHNNLKNIKFNPSTASSILRVIQ